MSDEINVYDIETYEENEKIIPYCISLIINKKKKIIYYDGTDLVVKFLNQIIEEIDKNIEIYSHNINFDGMIIVESLTKNSIQFNWYIRELNIYWINIFYMNFEIKLRCSYKILPLSVKKMGEILGYKKMIFPYKFAKKENLFYIGECPEIKYFKNEDEYKLFSQDNIFFNFKDVSEKYCIRDVEIVYQVMKEILKILRSYDYGVIKNSFSFSSISYKIFKKKFDKTYNITKSITLDQFIYTKKAFYGGKCEVFGNIYEDEIIHHFDFTGMYADRMKFKKYPVGESYFKIKKLDIKEIGIHYVKVKSNLEFPFLPYHIKNKLLFPNGEFWGYYNHQELDFFIKNGGEILDHVSSLVYESEDYVFSEYVSEFINIREKGKFYNVFGKSMNNGLYGSFALNVEDSFNLILFSEEELKSYIEKTNVIKWKKVNNVFFVEIKKNLLSKKFYKEEKSEYRNIIYSAYISSYARIRLHEAFKEVIKNDGRLLYTDTDSIFAAFKNNNIGKKMGEITWTDVYEDGVFISPKMYFIKNEKSKIKGISESKYNFDEIKYKFYNNEDSINFINQLQFNKKDYLLIQKYIDKKISLSSYDKRKFTVDKKKTTSIEIYE